jgi:iron(II)-dependent oxidoreductase
MGTSAPQVTDALAQARRRTLGLIDGLTAEQLESVHSRLMSPLVWDLGHIAAFEDLWLVHRHGERPLLHDVLMDVYDAFETPRADRGELPFLRTAEALAYLDAVRERTLAVITERGAGPQHELVVRHELQHQETMLQTLALARLPPGVVFPDHPRPPAPAWVRIDAGEATIGAGPDGFAYDNERPRFTVALGAYEICSLPVSNEQYRAFMQDTGAARPGGWDAALASEWRCGRRVAIDPAAPVMHVSWHEADALAAWAGARLPTELEWEHAAQRGALGTVGQVWEWTASCFDGYPGFVADPYPEYSEVFFGDRYRVLRGGSWATSPRVATLTFRNWDLPERRQIFSGLRLARDP